MNRARWRRCVALLAGSVGGAALACTPSLTGADVQQTTGERYVVAWRSTAPIRVSEFFGVDFAACSRDGGAHIEAARIDARMPAHRHGMNYRPQVDAHGDGRFQARGLLLHMPGAWELVFDLNPGATNAARETLRVPVLLR